VYAALTTWPEKITMLISKTIHIDVNGYPWMMDIRSDTKLLQTDIQMVIHFYVNGYQCGYPNEYTLLSVFEEHVRGMYP
jgi:hypothetical protein